MASGNSFHFPIRRLLGSAPPPHAVIAEKSKTAITPISFFIPTSLYCCVSLSGVTAHQPGVQHHLVLRRKKVRRMEVDTGVGQHIDSGRKFERFWIAGDVRNRNRK